MVYRNSVFVALISNKHICKLNTNPKNYYCFSNSLRFLRHLILRDSPLFWNHYYTICMWLLKSAYNFGANIIWYILSSQKLFEINEPLREEESFIKTANSGCNYSKQFVLETFKILFFKYFIQKIR